MDIYAIVISLCSLCLSGAVAYFVYFRKASIKMMVGKTLSFYPLPEANDQGFQWGGVGFYLPITFYNSAPQGGVIHEVRIILERKGSASENYDMAWYSFTQLHKERMQWVNKSMAHPFVVSGNNAASENILFAWRVGAGKELNIVEGEYELKILAWTSKDGAPALSYVDSFVVSSEAAKQYDRCVSNNKPLTVDVYLRESFRQNTVISKAQVKELYKI